MKAINSVLKYVPHRYKDTHALATTVILDMFIATLLWLLYTRFPISGSVNDHIGIKFYSSWLFWFIFCETLNFIHCGYGTARNYITSRKDQAHNEQQL